MIKILSVLIIVSVGLNLCACAFTSPISYPPVSGLLINETTFPEGWIAEESNTDFPPLAPWSIGRDEVEYVDRFYYASTQEGRAFIRIQRFKDSTAAAREYQHNTSVTFRVAEWYTPWIAPEEAEFESRVADQYRYACSMEGSKDLARPKCSYVGQYGVYVVEFDINLWNPQVFTYTDVLPMLNAIDERMLTTVQSE